MGAFYLYHVFLKYPKDFGMIMRYVEEEGWQREETKRECE